MESDTDSVYEASSTADWLTSLAVADTPAFVRQGIRSFFVFSFAIAGVFLGIGLLLASRMALSADSAVRQSRAMSASAWSRPGRQSSRETPVAKGAAPLPVVRGAPWTKMAIQVTDVRSFSLRLRRV